MDTLLKIVSQFNEKELTTCRTRTVLKYVMFRTEVRLKKGFYHLILFMWHSGKGKTRLKTDQWLVEAGMEGKTD